MGNFILAIRLNPRIPAGFSSSASASPPAYPSKYSRQGPALVPPGPKKEPMVTPLG